MTRTGKIARLPYGIRDGLNNQIRDNRPGVEILVWLNGMTETQRVLGRYFQGRPITEQNLTDWKAGGYLEWERHMEARELVEDMAGQAGDFSGDVEQKNPWHSVADRVSVHVAVELARSLKEISADPGLSSLQRLDAILKINQALAQLRRSDQAQKRQVWQAECKQYDVDVAEEEKEKEAERSARSSQMLRALYAQQDANHAERMNELRRQAEEARAPRARTAAAPVRNPEPVPATAPASYGDGEVWKQENGGERPAGSPAFQGESNQIKVNQA